jgi:hypothetical protein
METFIRRSRIKTHRVSRSLLYQLGANVSVKTSVFETRSPKLVDVFDVFEVEI